MIRMSVARHTYYIFIRNLRTWLSQPVAVVSTILLSAFFILFFGAPLGPVVQIEGFPVDDYEAYLTGMIIVMSVVFNGSDMAISMLTDILSGYFDKLLLAPINRFAILLASLMVAGVRAMAQVVVIVVLALALGVSFKGGPLGILAIIVMSSTFGIAWACLGLIIALTSKNAQVTQNSFLVFMPLVFLTTAFMPREFLSGWFKVAVVLNPVDYVLIGVRAIIIHGWRWEDILPGLAVLLAVTFGLMALAFWFFRRATV